MLSKSDLLMEDDNDLIKQIIEIITWRRGNRENCESGKFISHIAIVKLPEKQLLHSWYRFYVIKEDSRKPYCGEKERDVRRTNVVEVKIFM